MGAADERSSSAPVAPLCDTLELTGKMKQASRSMDHIAMVNRENRQARGKAEGEAGQAA